MKKILLIVLLFTCFMLQAEVLKFKAYESAIKEYSWQEWSDWKDTNLLVVFDAEKETVILYGNVIQDFDVIDAEEIDENNDLLTCIDEDGEMCYLRFRRVDDIFQLYITWDAHDLQIVYNLKLR